MKGYKHGVAPAMGHGARTDTKLTGWLLQRMAIHDSKSQRLFVDTPLAGQAQVLCDGAQANYLLNVLRMRAGGSVLLFNGRDGEWQARIGDVRKRDCILTVETLSRPQVAGPDLVYLFAPLKHARLDYMVQKATEMGVARLQPVITHRTVADRVNLERMRANAIEAAEQCGILGVPEVGAAMKLGQVLERWERGRTLLFCDESAPAGSAVAELGTIPKGPMALLVGPEGGFDAHERADLSARPFVRAFSLGPRIMRADTAAVAALALINGTIGGGW
jgi:16S rRNA (uracil1498-N3)-methyltransferase